MLSSVTALSVKLIQRYLPSPFVFAILLSLIVLAASMLVTGQGLPAMAQHWGTGFWNLLTFAMQMALILVTGILGVLANVGMRLLERRVLAWHPSARQQRHTMVPGTHCTRPPPARAVTRRRSRLQHNCSQTCCSRLLSL